MMYAPRVFVSMMGVLLAFALAVYWMTGSVGATLIQTVICAVILQVGYFIGVLYLVRREHLSRQTDDKGVVAAQRVSDGRRSEDRLAEAPANLKITEL